MKAKKYPRSWLPLHPRECPRFPWVCPPQPRTLQSGFPAPPSISDHILPDRRFLENPTQTDSLWPSHVVRLLPQALAKLLSSKATGLVFPDARRPGSPSGLLLGEVGTLGTKGAGGGASGWSLPTGVFPGLQCLHCTIHKVRGAFQPFTCDDKSQSCACRGGARLHLPFPLGRLGLWLKGLLKTAELKPGSSHPQKHAHSVRRFIHARSSH